MSKIGDLIQAYQDQHGTSDRALASRIGVTATLVGKWKRGTFVELPRKDRIEALSEQINVSYSVLLLAFLDDIGYLREESDGDDRNAAPMNMSDRFRMVAGEQELRVAKRPKKRE